MTTTLETPVSNELHRQLFALPPLRRATSTGLVTPAMPKKSCVTGDREVDAVLWLREAIATGDAALIAQAREAAKRIKTPLSELEKRYTEHLCMTNPESPFAVLSSFGFADLDSLANRSIKRRNLQVEAQSRFGNRIFDCLPSEAFCVSALEGIPQNKFGWFDAPVAAPRFRLHPIEMPASLAECIRELAYWQSLYRLRNAMGGGDELPEVSARQDFVFGLLAEISPRDRAEARSVLAFIYDNEREGDRAMRAILTNLIS